MKKKIISLFFCVVMVFSFAISASAAASAATWHIVGNSVNIRATEGGTSLGLVNDGDTFTNYGLSSTVVNNLYWRDCKMTSGQNNNVRGYVASGYTSYS